MADRKPDTGELLELRLARLLFAEGAFVRRSVDLRVMFGQEFTVTDIDVLALTFLSDLGERREIAECKSGLSNKAARAADRLLWGRGLRELLDVDRHLVVTSRPAGSDVRSLADRLGGDVLDEQDITRREGVLSITPDSPYGSHDPALLLRSKDHARAIKADEELKRAWRFVHAEGWLATPVAALKRGLGACQLLSRRANRDTTPEEDAAVAWLVQQATLVVCVSAVRIAAIAHRRPPEVFAAWLENELSSGAVPARELDRISRDVDDYVMTLLTRAGVRPSERVDALGFLTPHPPRYASALAELVARLAAQPDVAALLPRLLDWRIASAATSGLPAVAWAPADGDEPARLLRLLAAFVRTHGRVPDAVLDPIIPRAGAVPDPAADPLPPPSPRRPARRRRPAVTPTAMELSAPLFREEPPELSVESVRVTANDDEHGTITVTIRSMSAANVHIADARLTIAGQAELTTRPDAGEALGAVVTLQFDVGSDVELVAGAVIDLELGLHSGAAVTLRSTLPAVDGPGAARSRPA